MEVEFGTKNGSKEENNDRDEDCHEIDTRNRRSDYVLQVTKLGMDPWVVDSIEDLPWHVIMGIYENLDHTDLVRFMMTSRTVRNVIWDNEAFWRRHFERCFGHYIPRGFRGRWRPAFLATGSSGLSRTCPNARVYVHTPSLESYQGQNQSLGQGQNQEGGGDALSTPPNPVQREQGQGQEDGGWFHRIRRLERRMTSFFGGAEGGGAGYARRAEEVTTILVGVLGPGGSGKTDILRVKE